MKKSDKESLPLVSHDSILQAVDKLVGARKTLIQSAKTEEDLRIGFEKILEPSYNGRFGGRVLNFDVSFSTPEFIKEKQGWQRIIFLPDLFRQPFFERRNSFHTNTLLKSIKEST